MALSLREKETDRLAREVAALIGETLTDAVRKSLAKRLERERLRPGQPGDLPTRRRKIGEHCAALPDFDTRTPDEIVGYDENGMWRGVVIDTLALVAILLREPDADLFIRALVDAPVRLISAVSRVELSFVIEGRKGDAGRSDLEFLLRDGGIEVATVSPQQAELAIDAFRRFGKGRHRAALNIGDCFSYAPAAATEHPLLFKGDDFSHTDIRPALSFS